MPVTALALRRRYSLVAPIDSVAPFPSLAAWPALSLIEGDVRDFVFPQNACSHVIHAATDMTNLADPLHTYEVIVEGTKRVLAFAADRAVSRFMLISSGAIYGKQPPELSHLTEDFTGAPPTTAPRDAYGQGKRDCRVADKHSGRPVRHELHYRAAFCGNRPIPAARLRLRGWKFRAKTFLPNSPSAYWATVRRGGLTFTPPTWRSGFGPFFLTVKGAQRTMSVARGPLA